MTTELILLLKLLIFVIIWHGNAKLIIGFNRATQENMILDKVKLWSDKNLGEFWSKPVYSCPTCMSSFHGVIPFLITCHFLFGLTWTWHESILMNLAEVAFRAYGLYYYTLSLAGQTTYLNEH